MRENRRKMEAEAAEKRAREEQETEEKLDMNLTVGKFDETRGRLVIELFVAHFLVLAKRSNENRAYGQGLMYLLLVENLLRLLVDLKLYGAASHMDFKTELEHLRQINRGSVQDYWSVAWGPDERPGVHGSFKSRSAASKEQSQPLPKVPLNSKSPIPGTEKRNNNNNSSNGGMNFLTVNAEINV